MRYAPDNAREHARGDGKRTYPVESRWIARKAGPALRRWMIAIASSRRSREIRQACACLSVGMKPSASSRQHSSRRRHLTGAMPLACSAATFTNEKAYLLGKFARGARAAEHRLQRPLLYVVCRRRRVSKRAFGLDCGCPFRFPDIPLAETIRALVGGRIGRNDAAHHAGLEEQQRNGGRYVSSMLSPRRGRCATAGCGTVSAADDRHGAGAHSGAEQRVANERGPATECIRASAPLLLRTPLVDEELLHLLPEATSERGGVEPRRARIQSRGHRRRVAGITSGPIGAPTSGPMSMRARHGFGAVLRAPALAPGRSNGNSGGARRLRQWPSDPIQSPVRRRSRLMMR